MFPLISEKAVEEAVRNCEQLKRREQEEDNVTIEELEKQRVRVILQDFTLVLLLSSKLFSLSLSLSEVYQL